MNVLPVSSEKLTELSRPFPELDPRVHRRHIHHIPYHWPSSWSGGISKRILSLFNEIQSSEHDSTNKHSQICDHRSVVKYQLMVLVVVRRSDKRANVGRKTMSIIALILIQDSAFTVPSLRNILKYMFGACRLVQ